MVLAFEPDELQRLRRFIDFVSRNPTLLNEPQLDFVKVFVEKFGGKVPVGEFKLLDDDDWPFGGDDGSDGVKTEPKHAELELEAAHEEVEMDLDPETDHDFVDERDESDDDDERKDLEPIQTTTNTPNAVFLPETTTKRLKKHKLRKTRLSTRSHTNAQQQLSKEKSELPSSEDENAYNMNDYESCNESDPIDTAAVEVIIKTESADSKDCEQLLAQADENVIDDDDDDEEEDNDSDDSYIKLKPQKRKNKKRLVKPRRTRSNSNKKLKSDDKTFWKSVYQKKPKKPKPVNCDNCIHKCKTHIEKARRKVLCAAYWALSEEARLDYIIDCVESKSIGKIRPRKTSRVSRGFTNRYFMQGAADERVRVCLNFFMSTLCISNAIIKLAMESKIKKSEENAKTGVEGVAAVEATDATGDAKAVTGENIAEAVATNTTAAVETDASVPPVKPPTKFGWNKGKKFNMTRVPRPVKCDESCQMKCTQHFSAELRAQICQTFWSMDYKRRKDFVLTKIETREVNSMTAKEYRKTDRAQRTFTNRYFLKGPRSLNVRVCAAFFMATLCISRRVINNAIENADQQTGFYAGEDRRGKRTPGNKIPEVMLNEIKRHIESYPTWVPHKGYKTRFLHSSLNIKRLWREYKEICEQQQRKFASANYFSNVFHNNYRLAFLKPTSKHAHKVSAVKKEPLVLTDGAAAPPKKINTNISDFTGEEGGFWTRPQTVVAGHEHTLYEAAAAAALQLTTQTHTTTQSIPLTTQSLQAPLTQPLTLPAAQQTVVIEGKHNVLHIQENLQLHAPQSSTSSQSSVYATASYFPVVSYAPPQVPLTHQQQQQPPPPQQQQQPQLTEPILHGLANVSAMHGYVPANYEQQLPAVFRML